MKPSEALELLTLLPRHPAEFVDRVGLRLDLLRERLFLEPPRYEPRTWDEALRGLQDRLGSTLQAFLEEPALAEIELEVGQGIERIGSDPPFPLVHNSGRLLARLCYALCRALRPDVVVETGVAYGVSSSFLLRALEENGKGTLHSVDRPPFGDGAGDAVGLLVPAKLRHRWQLHRGRSREVLPGLLRELPPVGVFLHDSRHTYRNMAFEFQAITPHLAERVAVISDDVNRNRAFEDCVICKAPEFSVVIEEPEKNSLLGVGLFLAGPTGRPGRGNTSRPPSEG